MRKVSEQSIMAFLNGRNGKFGGVSNYNGRQNTTVKDGKFYLFGNCIAKFENNELYVRLVCPSATTFERLNALGYLGGYKLGVYQHKFEPYLNGELVTDYDKWYKVSKEA